MQCVGRLVKIHVACVWDSIYTRTIVIQKLEMLYLTMDDWIQCSVVPGVDEVHCLFDI